MQYNGGIVAQSIVLPNTGGTQKWETIEIKGVQLGNEMQALRIIAEEGGFNLKRIELKIEK